MAGVSSLKMRGWFGGLAETCLNMVLPPQCVACDAPVLFQPGFCPSCWAGLGLITPRLTDWQGMPQPFEFSSQNGNQRQALGERLTFRAAAPYSDTAAKVVSRLKYQDRHDMAGPMARVMGFAGADILAHADIVLPVPLHPAKLRKRRYNQSALLANRLGQEGQKLPNPLIRRVKNTRPQVGLSEKARARNVQDAFALTDGAEDYVEEKSIVIIDDVITTGATARACANAFLAAGARSVSVLAFARVVPQEH